MNWLEVWIVCTVYGTKVDKKSRIDVSWWMFGPFH